MSVIKQLSVILLAALVMVSCNTQPKKVAEVKVPVVYRVPYDTLTDDLAGFISGSTIKPEIVKPIHQKEFL